MKWVVLSILLAAQCRAEFPPWFKFGSGTSAHQIEGAWNVSDKAPSIWDNFCHNSPASCSYANGDIAADSYHLWREDVKAAADLGLDFYRFSISWPRILPNGFATKISEDGVRYYNNLIDGLLEKGIEPVITMYHWDLPQNLQDLGGWTNELISTWFADYARVLFSLFGDRVKTWMTINEPIIMCAAAYTGWLAPGINDPHHAAYLCAKNTLLAHAHAWRIYDEEYRPKYHGKISIINQVFWMESQEESERERKLGELTYIFGILYAYPVFSKNGGWHPEIEEIIENNSKKQGYRISRLPKFSKKEIEFIKGTYDFFGLNYYTSRLVKEADDNDLVWPFTGCPELGTAMFSDPNWRYKGDVDWLIEYPIGLRRVLEWIKKEFGDMEIIISEIGYADFGEEEPDYSRLRYHKEHLEQVDLAIQNGINVTAYTAWSLIDTFEWNGGYKYKFGLHKVDFDDPKRRRTPRASALYYADVIKTRSFDPPKYRIIDEL